MYAPRTTRIALLAAALAPLPMSRGGGDIQVLWESMELNRLAAPLTNLGVFGSTLGADPGSSGSEFEYPRASGAFNYLQLGLWVAGRAGGGTRTAIAEYASEWRPGPMAGGSWQPFDPAYRVWSVSREDTTGWAAWLTGAVPLGAPVSADGTAPGVLGHRTLWTVYNDADPALHPPLYGEGPIGLEVRQTAWAFREDGARDHAILLRWQIRHRGASVLDSAFVGVWWDADIAGRQDHAASDSALGLAYLYECEAPGGVYGAASPAIGVRLLRGAIGATGADLGTTAVAAYLNGDDPSGPDEIFRLMQGFTRQGDPVTDPGTGGVTRFRYGGDPRTGQGWLDPFCTDRKLLVASGPFTLAPGDSQEIVAAFVVGHGADALASVDSLYARAQADFFAPAGPLPPTPAPALAFAAFPNPTSGALNFRFVPADGERWRLRVLDLRGRTVGSVGEGRGDGRPVQLSWQPAGGVAPHPTPQGVPVLLAFPRGGLYWAELTVGGRRVTRKVAILAP